MKRFGLLALITVLALGLTVYLASCGGGGGGGGSNGSSLTSIATTTQGVKAAAALTASALNLTESNGELFDIVGGGMTAPKFKIPSSTTTNGKILDKLTAHFSPALKRARALKASYVSASGYPITTDCATGLTVTDGSTATPYSKTVDFSSDGSTETVTYNSCREGFMLTDGVITTVWTPSSTTMTFGTSDASPYSSIFYPDTISTTAESAMSGYFTIVFTESGTTSIIDSLVMNGWFENWDYVLDSHDKLVMNNVSMADIYGAPVTIDSIIYDVDTMTFNGSMTGTIYSSATATTVSYSETNGYSNFSITYKTSADPTASYYYASIAGVFSISTTPADQCIDGTFSIVTNTDVKFDSMSWKTAGGQITINGNTVVVFDTNGGATVSVNGGTPQSYTEAELASLCLL